MMAQTYIVPGTSVETIGMSQQQEDFCRSVEARTSFFSALICSQMRNFRGSRLADLHAECKFIGVAINMATRKLYGDKGR